MNDRNSAVSENFQRLRLAHGLSLSQVAERSGVAKATLYKVERGRTNPTLDTLSAIADSFSVEIEDIIAVRTRPAVEIVRAGEGKDISDDEATGFIVANMPLPAGTIEIHNQSFHANSALTSVSHGPGAREHVLVRKGSVLIGPLGHEVLIGPGDYASYAADTAHTWKVRGKGPAEVWIILTFARFEYHGS